MRRLGQLLMALGLLLGLAVGVATALPFHLVGVSWLIAVGLAKLTFVAGLGLIASGATLLRIAKRSEARLVKPNSSAL